MLKNITHFLDVIYLPLLHDNISQNDNILQIFRQLTNQ